jgi:hypothetical protein
VPGGGQHRTIGHRVEQLALLRLGAAPGDRQHAQRDRLQRRHRAGPPAHLNEHQGGLPNPEAGTAELLRRREPEQPGPAEPLPPGIRVVLPAEHLAGQVGDLPLGLIEVEVHTSQRPN